MDLMGGVQAHLECSPMLVTLEPFQIPSDILLGLALPLTTESDDLQAHLTPPPFYTNFLSPPSCITPNEMMKMTVKKVRRSVA